MRFSTQASGRKKFLRRGPTAMVYRLKPTNATTSSRQRFEAWTLENWRPNYADPLSPRPRERRFRSMAGTTGLSSPGGSTMVGRRSAEPLFLFGKEDLFQLGG